MPTDEHRPRRRIPAAVIFGIIAATIEMAVILYFLR
jgi:hypothetical protein